MSYLIYCFHYSESLVEVFYNAVKIYWEVLIRTGNYPNLVFNLKETYLDSTDYLINTNYFNIQTEQSDSILIDDPDRFFLQIK